MSIDVSELQVPPPTPTGTSTPFWEACAAGRFTLQHCLDCAHWVFYPRQMCPFCWSERLEWRAASGRGTVRSFTVIHRPGHPAWRVAVPYTVVVLDLEEGPRMLTALVDVEPADVRVGLPVEVTLRHVGDHTLPFFRPRTGTRGLAAPADHENREAR